MELCAFLKELIITWDHSTAVYKEYLAAGKIFRFAQQLKFCNSKAMDLLTTNKQLLPSSLQADAEALINHYSIWTQKWEALAKVSNPAPADKFVFANSVIFPKQAAQNLETLYKQLKQE